MAIQAAAHEMLRQLEHGNKVNAERSIANWLQAVEGLSIVRWRSTHQNEANTATSSRHKSISIKSTRTKALEQQLILLKRRWRRTQAQLDVQATMVLRKSMLLAKQTAAKSWKRDQRRHERGDWRLIESMRPGARLTSMWRQVRNKKSDVFGCGTMAMIEDGVRQVAQTGFKHNQLESEAWAGEMHDMTTEAVDIDDTIIKSKELWKLKYDKAMGEDGWCEEMLMLLQKLDVEVVDDLHNMMRLAFKYAVLPRYQRGALLKAVLKPGKMGTSHNEYRKLSLMSVIRKQIEKMGSLTMRRYWTAGEYQAGFKKGKRTVGRIFVLLATVAAALWPLEDSTHPVRECGVLLVDFEQFFDTLRQERLFKKMQNAGIPVSVISLWRELSRTHRVRVIFKGEVGKPIVVLVGVPQGSGWSPELATLYVDFGLAGELETVSHGVVELAGECKVHLLMFADDLLTPNRLNSGAQQQFAAIERVSEEDGLQISYKKSELIVFRIGDGPHVPWTITGNRGIINESDNKYAKYLGFFAEARGYDQHIQYLIKRMDAAGGGLVPLFAEHEQMNAFMRREIYQAKVRSMALQGAEIWGWRRHHKLERAEGRSFRILTRAHGRTRIEAMLWLMGLLPLWTHAARQAFVFLISVLRNGDKFEKAALTHWQTTSSLQKWGWFHEMLTAFQEVGILIDMGGEDAVNNWTYQDATHWQSKFLTLCNNKAHADITTTLINGKYSFMVSLLPLFSSPRPLSGSTGTKSHRALCRWFLSSHLLEIETGRYARITRERRWCRRCYLSLGIRVLGDEAHALQYCLRGAESRSLISRHMVELFQRGGSKSHLEIVS
ncbi:unnamed protein product [Polarella glacialis]|uniref:Reverse transcriptase domain-containing protein n=1 Tax=Polarella glacialis TaxID=89957 RepID=A0A813HCK2_POLGL|nr:unnamed protein product [Polarella glacialis]